MEQHLSVNENKLYAADSRKGDMMETPRDKVVVVIDDDAMVLEAMTGLLQGWGYQVIAASTDDQALLELVKLGRRPDLIICDYRLSQGRIGVDAIDRVRKAFGIPAFVISADVRAHNLQDPAGDQFLVLNKPVSPTALQAAVSRALNIDDPSSDDE